VELGRIDIITEVSMLSTYICLLREGHLEAVFHVFVYLGLHHNAGVVFDPTYPAVDMGTFIKTDWKSMYGDVKEMFLQMFLFLVERRLICACLLILIMLVSNSQGVQGRGLSYT
jgi:hypothetical protein